MKLDKVVELYQEVFKERRQLIEASGSLQEALCLELMTDIEDVEDLLQVVTIAEERELTSGGGVSNNIPLSEFLACFEIDGDFSSERSSFVRIRAANDPSVLTIIEKAPTMAFSWCLSVLNVKALVGTCSCNQENGPSL